MSINPKTPAKWHSFFQAFFYGLAPAKNRRPSSVLEFAGLAAFFGMGLAVRLYLAVFVGSWLDKHFNIQPYGLLLAVLVALLLSFWSLFRHFPFGE